MGIKYGSGRVEEQINQNLSELNRAIMGSHYPLPTIEQVAAHLNKAKVFTVLDAKTRSNLINSPAI